MKIFFVEGSSKLHLKKSINHQTSIGVFIIQLIPFFFACLLVVLAFPSTRAESDVIESFDQSGVLTFTQQSNAVYKVEWASTPDGPWRQLFGVASTNAPGSTVRVDVPMFYRIQAVPEGMVLIPAGAYVQGDTLDGETNAAPVTTTVSDFYMDVHEVTVGLWQSVKTYADANGYTFTNPGFGKAADHPVHSVNWYDCIKWCNARSQQAGKTPVYYTDAEFAQVYTNGETTVYARWDAVGYRLPTEAEWEKAARGGLLAQRFPWGNEISHGLANFNNDFIEPYQTGTTGFHPAYNDGTIPFTSPAGSFLANQYGLYDMVGNVSEWCWDNLDLPVPVPPYAGGTDPRGPNTGEFRIRRGGHWYGFAFESTCAARNLYFPDRQADGAANDDITFSTLGFRTVLAVGSEPSRN